MANLQKTREVAFFLPVAGVLLLLSPLVSLFKGDGTLFGIPVAVVYVFGVWIALIIVAVLLARRLRSSENH